MPYAFLDGFDDYSTGWFDIGVAVGSTWVNASGSGTGLTAGRFGNRALFLATSIVAYRGIPETDQVTSGFAVKFPDLGGAGAGIGGPFHQLRNNLNQIQCGLHVNDLGYIMLVRSNDTILGTCAKPVINNSWHFIEYEIKIDDGVGSCKLWIDGEPQLNLVNIDTKGQVVGQANRFSFNGHPYSDGCNFDDAYCLTGELAAKGESRAQLMPVTTYVLEQWTPLTGDSNAAMIDEQQCDMDTTYNSTSTVGAKDLFELLNVTGNPETIHAVQVSIAARKDDAGTRVMNHIPKHGGVEWLGPNQFQTTSYTFQRLILEENPVTTDPWTLADVNALQAGYQLAE